jgi:hypothetical protein
MSVAASYENVVGGYGTDMSMYSVEECTVVKHVMAKID